jgi:hypothetical protein
MPRTTVNSTPPYWASSRGGNTENGSRSSELVNQLLARALAETESTDEVARPLRWTTRAMGPRIDLEDKDALRQALDEA